MSGRAVQGIIYIPETISSSKVQLKPKEQRDHLKRLRRVKKKKERVQQSLEVSFTRHEAQVASLRYYFVNIGNSDINELIECLAEQ